MLGSMRARLFVKRELMKFTRDPLAVSADDVNKFSASELFWSAFFF